jgi:phospholipase A-2-activating protein
MFEGKKYDRVFDVELDGHKWKLPYNLSENPYTAAQNFIHKNDLDQDFLDDIAKWIIT